MALTIKLTEEQKLQNEEQIIERTMKYLKEKEERMRLFKIAKARLKAKEEALSELYLDGSELVLDGTITGMQNYAKVEEITVFDKMKLHVGDAAYQKYGSLVEMQIELALETVKRLESIDNSLKALAEKPEKEVKVVALLSSELGPKTAQYIMNPRSRG